MFPPPCSACKIKAKSKVSASSLEYDLSARIKRKKLSAVDVEGVEPSAHAHSIYNVWREDVPTAGMSIDDALLNAPAKRENQIVVPKVVDDA